MRLRKFIARLAGTLYLLVGVMNLIGLLVPETREQVISLSAVLFRYTGMVGVGVGLLLLKKWSVYVLALVLAINFVLFYTVYGGQIALSGGYMALLPLAGPALIIVLYFYIWPALAPQQSGGSANDA
jgi:hypothetical protein